MKRLWSKITEDLDFCIECGRPRTCIHHCLYGNKRKNADEDGLVVPMCSECHYRLHNTSPDLSIKYKKIAQEIYENDYGHERYMDRYGKNYL